MVRRLVSESARAYEMANRRGSGIQKKGECSVVKKGIAVLGGIGIGAGLMFVFDPDRGKRRRTLMRDKVAGTANKLSCTAGKMNRDLRNRAAGLMAEAKGLFKQEEIADEVLIDRVRSKIGRVISNAGAVEVAAKDGKVTLSGTVLVNEADKLLRKVRLVRGVKDVENRLEVDGEAGEIPALQGPRAAAAG